MAKRTREQNLALMTDRHVAVTANAGSGKTRVLVERYLELISKSDSNSNIIDIEEIAAITFTKKAAAEMKAKIIRVLNDKIKEFDNDLKKTLFFDDLRDNMIYANISTIHSFCYQILKDYPIEAEIPPNFGELSDFDHYNIINDSIDETLENLLEKNNPQKNEFLFDLVQKMEYTNLRNSLKKLLSSGESYNIFIKFYSDKTIEELLDFYNDHVFKFLKNSLIYYITTLLNHINSIYEINSKHIEKIKLAHNELKNNLIFIENENTDISNLLKFYDDFMTILKEKAGRSFILTQIVKFIDDNSFQISENNIKSIFSVYNLYSQETIRNLQIEYLNTLLIFKDTAIEIHNLIEKSKYKIPAFTFDDILIKTLELLEKNNNDVREKIRRKLKYLLVDEFQDTNQIQYNIIKYLIPDFDIVPSNYNSNLFIVGDDKQSIYSFRSADVRVFNQIKKDIRSINSKKINESKLNVKLNTDSEEIILSNTESEGLIDLSASFRLKPAIASFVNSVCSKIMQTSTFSQYEVQYKPLIFARNSQQFYKDITFKVPLKMESNKNPELLINSENHVILRNKNEMNSEDYINLEAKYGSINFFFSIKPYNKVDNSSKEFSTESEMIADFIKSVVTGEANIKIEDENGNEKTPDYRDIAIISRKKKNLSELSGILIKNKIPYVVDAGKGFFDAQEVIDIISLLKFFRNENNDIALAGALKSQMFGLNDSDLLGISLSKNNESFWNKFINYYNDNQQNYLVSRAFNLITELMKVALYIPISKLILKIIESTAIIGAVNFETKGKQMKANLNQLISFARNFESKGFKTLHDFVSQIDDMSEFSSESEANISSSDNVVKIMTIHGAKGLEFPVLILINANSNTKGKNESFKIDKDLGISYQLHYDINNESVQRQITTPINTLINTHIKSAESAEEKRLLYVALTRAKDHLAIFSTLDENKSGEISSFKGMLTNILHPLGIDKNNILEIIDSGVFFIQDNLKILFEDEIKNINLKIPIKFSNTIENNYKEIDLISNKSGTLNQEFNIDSEVDNNIKNKEMTSNIEYDLINPEERFEIFSASKLSSFTNDRLNYELNYILGLPSMEDINFEGKYPDTETGNDEIIGTYAGTYIHAVLEFINNWFNGNEINESEFWKIINKIEQNQEVKLSDQLKERIYFECSNITKTEFIRRNYHLIKNAKFEYQLNLPLEDDILTSSIDVLVQDNLGNFEIWDWKSNKLTVDSIEKLGYKYDIQLRLYSYIISLLNPKQEFINSRLLFTRLAKNKADDHEWIYSLSISRIEALEFVKWIKENAKKSKNILDGFSL